MYKTHSHSLHRLLIAKAKVLGAHPAVNGILDAAHGRYALVQRPLVGLAIVQHVIEHERGVRGGRHRDVQAREASLSSLVDVVEVDEEGEVPVAIHPGLARVVVVVMRLVELARMVAHRLQSVAISGNRWQSVAISGNRWQSVAISGNPWQSEAIRGHQHASTPAAAPS